MRRTAEAKLREIALGADLPTHELAAIEAASTVCLAAEALLEDIRLRHPGEDFKCPYIIALDEALANVA